MREERIKVLIVDDSKIMQQILMKIFSLDPDIEVVGVASDPFIARDLIKTLQPDVLTLDIEMPKMDGITFLKNLMRLHPMPVIMVSSFTEKGSAITLEALALGAVDYIKKPATEELHDLGNYANRLIQLVKNASQAKVRSPLLHPFTHSTDENNTVMNYMQPDYLSEYIIAIGASTGGIEAIERVLAQLPVNMPGIVIVQHIHKDFSTPFVHRLDKNYHSTVLEAHEGLEIKPGHIIVAKSETHLEVVRKRGKYICRLNRGPKLNGHKPSIDVLFYSLALAAGEKSIAVLLTGMGKDGARGMGAIQQAGGETIAQDEASSVVWGMPGFAVDLQAANYILPIDEIGKHIIQQLQRKNANEKTPKRGSIIHDKSE
ncbi:MAG: chemotaxis response regulator protein-glutamate methylesterase [Gammaproteobacteria bacterium]|nr:MAG: chemotaxis response regulator protein-glutamate methylesterase [Gammaproteobacteria bacterium]